VRVLNSSGIIRTVAGGAASPSLVTTMTQVNATAVSIYVGALAVPSTLTGICYVAASSAVWKLEAGLLTLVAGGGSLSPESSWIRDATSVLLLPTNSGLAADGYGNVFIASDTDSYSGVLRYHALLGIASITGNSIAYTADSVPASLYNPGVFSSNGALAIDSNGTSLYVSHPSIYFILTLWIHSFRHGSCASNQFALQCGSFAFGSS
jgi:hypothetical protein